MKRRDMMQGLLVGAAAVVMPPAASAAVPDLSRRLVSVFDAGCGPEGCGVASSGADPGMGQVAVDGDLRKLARLRVALERAAIMGDDGVAWLERDGWRQVAIASGIAEVPGVPGLRDLHHLVCALLAPDSATPGTRWRIVESTRLAVLTAFRRDAPASVSMTEPHMLFSIHGQSGQSVTYRRLGDGRRSMLVTAA